MDYDTDNKTMATLRRQLRKAHEEYYRRKRYDTHQLFGTPNIALVVLPFVTRTS